jgi:hypothetical protein
MRLSCTYFITSAVVGLARGSNAFQSHITVAKPSSHHESPEQYHVHSATVVSTVRMNNGKGHQERVEKEETVDKQAFQEPVIISTGKKVITDCDGDRCTRKEEPLSPAIKAGANNSD